MSHPPAAAIFARRQPPDRFLSGRGGTLPSAPPWITQASQTEPLPQADINTRSPMARKPKNTLQFLPHAAQSDAIFAAHQSEPGNIFVIPQ
jgi:hypothetical protein